MPRELKKLFFGLSASSSEDHEPASRPSLKQPTATISTSQEEEEHQAAAAAAAARREMEMHFLKVYLILAAKMKPVLLLNLLKRARARRRSCSSTSCSSTSCSTSFRQQQLKKVSSRHLVDIATLQALLLLAVVLRISSLLKWKRTL